MTREGKKKKKGNLAKWFPFYTQVKESCLGKRKGYSKEDSEKELIAVDRAYSSSYQDPVRQGQGEEDQRIARSSKKYSRVYKYKMPKKMGWGSQTGRSPLRGTSSSGF